jgi:hypothetical protein
MNTKLTFIMLLMVILSSCSETHEFPVSKVTPGADITAEIKEQDDPNYLVTLEAKNLAAPERLQNPKNIYVIWVVSEKGTVRNTGHFNPKNESTSTFKASFPYQPVEIFITAEDEESTCLPYGIEITRLNLNKEKK